MYKFMSQHHYWVFSP